MTEPLIAITKPEPAAHTPGPWCSEASYGRKSAKHPLTYCGEYIRAGDDFVASTWSNGDELRSRANGCLIAQAPALLAHADKSLRWLIAERDCYYEGCATAYSGEVLEQSDRDTLDAYDRDIDALRALIAAARGEA